MTKQKRTVISQLFVFLLFVIALVVAVQLLYFHAADWRWIASYWVTLTCKNGFDLLSQERR